MSNALMPSIRDDDMIRVANRVAIDGCDTCCFEVFFKSVLMMDLAVVDVDAVDDEVVARHPSTDSALTKDCVHRALFIKLYFNNKNKISQMTNVNLDI